MRAPGKPAGRSDHGRGRWSGDRTGTGSCRRRSGDRRNSQRNTGCVDEPAEGEVTIGSRSGTLACDAQNIGSKRNVGDHQIERQAGGDGSRKCERNGTQRDIDIGIVHACCEIDRNIRGYCRRRRGRRGRIFFLLLLHSTIGRSCERSSFGNPSASAKQGEGSASTAKTCRPASAYACANKAASVVLPTPPLPLIATFMM